MNASKAKGSKKGGSKKGADKAGAKAKHVKPAKPVKPAKAPAKEARVTGHAEKHEKGGRPPAEKPGKHASKEKEPKLRRAAPPIDEEVEGEEAEAEEPEVVEAEAADDDDIASEEVDITGRTEMKALLDRGREKGFVTFDEVNDALPNDIGADQMDDVMSMFGEHDIEVVDGQVKKLPDKPPEPEPKDEKEEKEEEEDPGYGKSNDPVRLYLRKMGSVSLLTREGEVEIAKRIESGEKEVLASVLSSSISTREILELGDRLRKGKIRVREIIKESGEDSQAEPEEPEEEVEVVEADAAAPAEGVDPDQPVIPKEDEKKVEHVLKHIDRIRKSERDLARIKESFFPQAYPVFPRGVPPNASALRFAHRYVPAATLGGDF
jgi:RNA polymerase primary sigma factor